MPGESTAPLYGPAIWSADLVILLDPVLWQVNPVGFVAGPLSRRDVRQRKQEGML